MALRSGGAAAQVDCGSDQLQQVSLDFFRGGERNFGAVEVPFVRLYSAHVARPINTSVHINDYVCRAPPPVETWPRKHRKSQPSLEHQLPHI